MKWAKLLRTVPGIGYYSALLIVSEVGDISRFSDSYHLCSYAGLVPSTHSSGGVTHYGSSITKADTYDGSCKNVFMHIFAPKRIVT